MGRGRERNHILFCGTYTQRWQQCMIRQVMGAISGWTHIGLVAGKVCSIPLWGCCCGHFHPGLGHQNYSSCAYLRSRQQPGVFVSSFDYGDFQEPKRNGLCLVPGKAPLSWNAHGSEGKQNMASAKQSSSHIMLFTLGVGWQAELLSCSRQL